VKSKGTRRSPAVADESAEPIAIIGAACRFPGAHGLDAFWRLLHEGVDAVQPITRRELDPSRFYDARPQTPGRMSTRWGGFLDDLEQFDADFFGISPREAEKLDPAQRILLEATWEACEDAGIVTTTLSGKPVGVFVGQWLSDFESRLFAKLDEVDLYATTGTGRYATAGRLSYVLGLTGPSVSVDTACSSSLVAVHLACQSLRSGETSLAFAAGVNVILQPHITVAYSQSGMMAADGRCKFGDADGDGYVRSEGVGVLLLKRLSQAIADGDHIHAVIRGSAVNNDGRGSGHLATPSREGQAAMLRTAYAQAGVAPAAVEYVEAHGTGTRVGDPIELGALGDVLTFDRDAVARCYVGSVKTNIGHTEGAAGMAGLIKTMLAMEHEEIPASLHLNTPNPAIAWAELPFEIPKQPVAWPRGERPRTAGVSAFGIAGTNAHVVLEEAPSVATPSSGATVAPTTQPDEAWPLVLSAASRVALRAMASSYADRLTAADAPALRDVAATAALHRTALSERAVFVASDRVALVEKLRAFAAGDDQGADAVRRADNVDRRRVAFVFPGQGGQWIGMGRELLATEPAFAEAIARCDAALPTGTPWTVREQLLAEPGGSAFRLHEIAVLQPVLVVVEIALAELWRSLGIEPDAVIGHSMGEVGAAYCSGALSLEDAMLVICERSRLLQRTSGTGAMAALELSADETSRRIAAYGDRLCVAVVNGPRSTVISGEPDAVNAVRAACEREGIFCRAVKVDVASHSTQMDPLVPELVAHVGRVQPRETTTALYSTVDAVRRDGASLDARYWGRNLRSTVQFAPTIERMLDDGIDTFIEVSPHPALLVAIAQVAGERRGKATSSTLAVPSLRRNEPERATLLASFGGLWAAGQSVDWTKLVATNGYTRVSLPSYPWQRERHWPALASVDNGAATTASAAALDERQRDWLYVSRWKPAPIRGADAPKRWLLVGNPRELRALGDGLLKRGGAATAYPNVDAAALALAAAQADGREVGIVVVGDATDARPAWNAVEALRAFQNAHDASATPPRVWWITRGAHRVAGEALSARAAEQGSVWGAARVLATEHPDWWGGLVDLEAETALQLQSDALAGHLTATRTEDQVAIRGGTRFALRFSRADASIAEAAPLPWRADGAYLITGGFGEVPQAIASEMVRQGVRRLVLLSRGALPPRAKWAQVPAADPVAKRVAFVRALEHAGASVHVLQADVANPAQLETALAAYAAEGWPAIVGVVHAAGLLDSRFVERMDAAAFERVLHPKLQGAITLDRLFPTLDLFVLFSSMMAFWAPAGMSNYAAANAGLDALATARRARGQHAVSIQWGPWENLGLYRDATEVGATSDLAREGVAAFSANEGTRLLTPIVSANQPVVAVLPIDWAKFADARRGREPFLFREMLDSSRAETNVLTTDSVRARFAGMTDGARRGLLETIVRGALSGVLRRPAEQLDLTRPFGTMGLDSLMGLELRNRLESAVEHALPATIAWNYPTVALLVAHLESLVVTDIAASPSLAQSPVSAERPRETAADAKPEDAKPRESGGFGIESLFVDVAELSDEDAAAALRRGA
jgi:phthiocerol/phenolphthiocerol synthesis type-I polyketide synthase B